MRPYVIEVCFAFAAGMCVGAWLMEHSRASEVLAAHEKNAPIEKEMPKKGVMVTMEDGKIIIDPSRRKRWFHK